MKIIKPYVKEIIFHTPEGYGIEAWLERAGRVCYKSEKRITSTSAPKFIRMLRDRGHYAMIEHAVASAIIVGDRGMTHELIRHRIAAFAQESTRYCNYSKGKFSGEITVVSPDGMTADQEYNWYSAMMSAQQHYMHGLALGMKSEIARGMLPINLKAEIVITANLREWMHVFDMRCDTPAHPVIRKCSLEILRSFNKRLPSIYEKQAERFVG